MRLVEVRPPLCDRAREWISLQLDGELSEFERVLLDGHLVHCADCTEFRAGGESISGQLRRAPLARLERPVVLPRRSRVSARVLPVVGAAAAAVVVAVGSTIGVSTVSRSDHATSTRPAYLDSAESDMKIIKQIQTSRLLATIRRAN
jgi:predicted anti-sigma-YlaC factor YlaD